MAGLEIELNEGNTINLTRTEDRQVADLLQR